MNSARVTVGSVIGALAALVLSKYGIHVDKAESTLIGSCAVGVAIGIVHVVAEEGIAPAVRRVIVGPPPKTSE